MRALGLALLLALCGWAEPRTVTVQCQPDDAHVFLVRPGSAPELKGRAGEPLPMEIPAGSQLLCCRIGWQESGLPVTATPTYTMALQPLTDWNSRGHQFLYYAGRFAWMPLGLAGLLASGAALLRAAGRRRREQTLRALELSLPAGSTLSLKQLGGYRLLDLLGAGGMAEVYRALPEATLDPTQAVAIKVLQATDSAEIKRFRREIQICQDLQHPNMVRLIAHGVEDGYSYLVMELLRGETLRDLLDRQPKMTARQALQRLLPLLEALDVMHQGGIVHRDLKPENLFLTEAGVAKIMDFGVARGESYTVATDSGLSMGTPAYMAPEQVEGALNMQSDQYAMGVILYEMISGQLVFDHPDPVQQAYMHLDRAPAPLRSLVPEVPALFDDALLKMLAKRPEQRFANLHEAGQQLLLALGTEKKPE